jgi:endonuclease/exonuclease/phosphatase family metal-dependent hydrolase
MGKIRVATMNVENLLDRFNFYSYGRLTTERALRLLGVEEQSAEYLPLRKSLNVALTDDSRQQTAQAIRDTKADLVCLQEVDNRQVLDDFHDFYLDRTAGVHYGWRRLIEGNDNRGIDVAVMSKTHITVTSHADVTFHDFGLFNDELRDYGLSEGDAIFRRDCLEVKLKVGARTLVLFVCHFKSLSGGRDQTRCVREAEAKAVRRIIEDEFKAKVAQSNWLIVGDLNDYTRHEGHADPNHALKPLLQGGFSVNLLDHVPEAQRWTHYYSQDRTKHQLDYILASPAIAQKNPNAKLDIIRKGQPYRVTGIEDVPRYPRTGFDRPKASDHCPVAVTLEI